MRAHILVILAVLPFVLVGCDDGIPATRTICGNVDSILPVSPALQRNILVFSDGRRLNISGTPQVTVSGGRLYSFKVDDGSVAGWTYLYKTEAVNTCGHEVATDTAIALRPEMSCEITATDSAGVEIFADSAGVETKVVFFPSGETTFNGRKDFSLKEVGFIVRACGSRLVFLVRRGIDVGAPGSY